MSEYGSSPGERRSRRRLRLLLVPLDLLVGLFVLLDELARPLYRPLLRWFASLRIVARAEVWIAGLPPYGVLATLALPFAVAEPAKLLALLVMARGALLPGLVLMGVAHLLSFLVVERIYHAGRAQLLRIGWFAWCMGLLIEIRDAILARLRETALWQRAVGWGRGLRRWARSARLKIARLLRR